MDPCDKVVHRLITDNNSIEVIVFICGSLCARGHRVTPLTFLARGQCHMRVNMLFNLFFCYG